MEAYLSDVTDLEVVLEMWKNDNRDTDMITGQVLSRVESAAKSGDIGQAIEFKLAGMMDQFNSIKEGTISKVIISIEKDTQSALSGALQEAEDAVKDLHPDLHEYDESKQIKLIAKAYQPRHDAIKAKEKDDC